MRTIAYHITWTTYGTWLPGDGRGWVTEKVPGIQEPDPARQEEARRGMAETAVLLTDEQRALVEQTVRDHCRIRGWTLHALNVRSNHVHVVVSADRDADEVMNQFKAWCSRRLSDQAGLTTAVARKAGRRRWWTEHGSTKHVHDEDYLRNAVEYVLEKQGT
jgi:REP element-mobilizing transposase RayT